MSVAEEGSIFRRARGRTLDAFPAEKEKEWKGPFYFIQGADPQFGLMKAWSTGDCDNGGDEWGQEIRLTQQAVQAINKLRPKPKFFVLCGDLIHAMPALGLYRPSVISCLPVLSHPGMLWLEAALPVEPGGGLPRATGPSALAQEPVIGCHQRLQSPLAH